MKFEHRTFVMVGAARGANSVNGILYNALTLNFLANAVADECGVIFGGMRASSVVSVLVTTTLMLDLSLVPVLSAILDGTGHRFSIFLFAHFTWALGVLFGAVLLVATDEPTETQLTMYFVSLCVVSLTYEVSGVLHVAYLPEIAATEKEATVVASSNTFVVAVMNIALVLFSTGVGLAFDLDDKGLGVVASLFVFAAWAVWSVPGILGLAKLEWGGHMQRVAPSDASDTGAASAGVLGAGQVGVSASAPAKAVDAPVAKRRFNAAQVLQLAKLCWTTYHDVGLFLVSYAFFLPAVGSSVVLATGFLQNGVGYSGSTISLLTLLTVMVSAPSAYLARLAQSKVGIKRTLVFSLLLWTAASLLIPWTVKGERVPLSLNATDLTSAGPGGSPTTASLLAANFTAHCSAGGDDQDEPDEEAGTELRPTAATLAIVPFFAVAWGVGVSVIGTANTAMFSGMVPGGKERGFFGLKTTSGKLLGWLPSFIFVIVNESTGNLELAMFSISMFFVASLPFILMVDMDRAAKAIHHTQGMRRRSVATGLAKPGPSTRNLPSQRTS